jgi:3-mercaptopyruvate sulfurtransferase SseA
MRSIILASFLLLMVAGALAAAGAGLQKESARQASSTTGAQTQPTPADGVRRVTVEELRAGLEKGTAVVVDVRSTEQYKTGHIKGARSVPGDELASRVKELPKDKLIVFYCS